MAAVALLVATATITTAADVTGKWQSEFDLPMGHLKYTYGLRADGDKLTGKAVRELAAQKTEIELKEGKLDGDKISFVEIVSRDGQDFRIEYNGKLSGDEIKFTRKVGDFATTEMVATRVKSVEASAETAPTNKIVLKFIKVDSEETVGEDGHGTNAVDGKPGTFWHTEWQDDSPAPPHEIIVELVPPARIKGFTCLPRQDEQDGAPMQNGNIKDYEFYVSNDGKDFGKPVKKGTFSEGPEKKTVTFDPVQCRFIKLKTLSEINDQAWTSVAEIGVIPE